MALFRKKTEEEISETKAKKEAHRAEIEAKVEARFPGIKKQKILSLECVITSEIDAL